jgi:hypothetical protein
MAIDHAGKHPGLPQDEPLFRVAHLVRDRVLRKALRTAEDELGPIPLLPKDQKDAAGSDDEWSIFYCAWKRAELENARHDLVEAEFFAAGGVWLSGKELAQFQALRRVANARRREEMVRFARVPAMTRRQLKLKKRIISSIWSRQDVFSEALARDEAYLRTKAKAPTPVVA